MIDGYRQDDALNAVEDVLLVPAPIRESRFSEGFIGHVVRTFPIADVRLKSRGGVNAGDILFVGHLGEERRAWIPPYTLAFAGIHYRNEQNGWQHSPELLAQSLGRIAEVSYWQQDTKVATAGIPGTGWSGLSGSADIDAIRQTLEDTPMKVYVYQDSYSGDRAEVLEADPPKVSREYADLPDNI